jgi:hypothetical protein
MSAFIKITLRIILSALLAPAVSASDIIYPINAAGKKPSTIVMQFPLPQNIMALMDANINIIDAIQNCPGIVIPVTERNLFFSNIILYEKHNMINHVPQCSLTSILPPSET